MSDPNTHPEEQAIDAEHSNVISEENREKRDENNEAAALLESDDLSGPTIAP